jgi:hypothetical protein
MLNKRAQGLSVHTIIVAIIGLIILVAIILMLTGKLGTVGKGVGSPTSCESACNAIGMDDHIPSDKTECDGFDDLVGINTQYIPGNFRDVPDNKCCCRTQTI